MENHPNTYASVLPTHSLQHMKPDENGEDKCIFFYPILLTGGAKHEKNENVCIIESNTD